MRDNISPHQKNIARGLLFESIKKGIIVRPDKCQVCGTATPVQGHHENYNEPLNVIWLCSGCHIEIHKANNWKIDKEKETISGAKKKQESLLIKISPDFKDRLDGAVNKMNKMHPGANFTATSITRTAIIEQIKILEKSLI